MSGTGFKLAVKNVIHEGGGPAAVGYGLCWERGCGPLIGGWEGSMDRIFFFRLSSRHFKVARWCWI